MNFIERWSSILKLNKSISKIIKDSKERDWKIQISKIEDDINISYVYSGNINTEKETYLSKFGFTGLNCHPQWISTTKPDVYFYIYPCESRYMDGFMAFNRNGVIKCDTSRTYKLDSNKFSRAPISKLLYKMLCDIMPEPIC